MKHRSLSTTQADPAMVRAIVVAVFVLLAALGIGWAADPSPELVGALVVLGAPLVALMQGLWTRYAVTANAKVIARVTTAGDVVAGDAAAQPTGAGLSVYSGDAVNGAAPTVAVAVRGGLTNDA